MVEAYAMVVGEAFAGLFVFVEYGYAMPLPSILECFIQSLAVASSCHDDPPGFFPNARYGFLYGQFAAAKLLHPSLKIIVGHNVFFLFY